MTEEEFVTSIKLALNGRYVPITEWKKYIQFSQENNFELNAIFELIRFCIQIKKNNKIREKYIMACLKEYLYLNLNTKSKVLDYIKNFKRINLRQKRVSYNRNYNDHELDYLFTRLEEIKH